MKTTFPDKIFEQHIAVLGKTGSGKSSTMRGAVEYLLDKKRPVCIIDPKGDWWGLKASADGKSAGYPVVIFGGKHADVPINEHDGKSVAELVATGNRPCIIDLGGWMPGARTRFFIDFASTFFTLTTGMRWLVIDEVHNFAPKGKILSPQAGEMLHWANRLASEGRGKGVNLIGASQRPQKVHNDFLTSCETLIAMRVIHPSDREAIADWIKGAGDAAKGKEVLDTLAKMKRGEGWVWSPEIEFGPERVHFPMFTTYDSFKAQANSGQVTLKGWAEVDLEEVKGKLARTIEEAKKNDPRELHRQIAELKKQLDAKAVTVTSTRVETKVKIVEKPIFKDGHVKRLEGAAEKVVKVVTDATEKIRVVFAEAGGDSKTITNTLAAVLAGMNAPAIKVPAPTMQRPTNPTRTAPARAFAQAVVGGDGDNVTGGLRRILIALAQRPGLTNGQIGVRSGLSSNSGSFGTYMSRGRSSGWIRDEGDRKYITDSGLAAVGQYELLPTGPALLNYWKNELGGGASRILSALEGVWPNTMTNEQIGEAANISSSSGSFGTYMSRLRTLELIHGGRGATKASDELFE